MRSILYVVIKKITQFAFYLYYKKVDLIGTEQIPTDRPNLFLPNHQNGLMDPLVMAAFSKGKPYFLTRSDIFSNAVLRAFFDLLHMMPIYRMRDGRGNLHKNQEIFERCVTLLRQNESLVMFPEGGHNIQRRVRPLSKGFTRILFLTLEKDPKLDIALIPVGINYRQASGFPDSAVFYFGDPLSIQNYPIDDVSGTIVALKEDIHAQLVKLTTHIEDLDRYEEILAALDRTGVSFLEPERVNKMIATLDLQEKDATIQPSPIWKRAWDLLFFLLNLPMIALWRLGPKRFVPEIEFKTTFRFLYSLLFYPIFYLGSFAILLKLYMGWETTIVILLAHAVHNFLYVKLR